MELRKCPVSHGVWRQRTGLRLLSGHMYRQEGGEASAEPAALTGGSLTDIGKLGEENFLVSF